MTEPTNPWRTVDVRTVYETPWIGVEHHEVIKPNGQPGIYGVVRQKKVAVGVLPIAADGSVQLVGQWRYALDAYSWEMPEGGCEPDETAEACARRELAEEAGVTAAHLVEVLRMHTSNSVSDEYALCYIGYGLSPASGELDDTEVITRAQVPFAEVLAQVADGRITDSMTVACVLRAYHMAMTGGLPPDLARAMLGKGSENNSPSHHSLEVRRHG